MPPTRKPSRTGCNLRGKRVYVFPMARGTARAFAAAFRAFGIEADVTPPSDQRTREVGARFTCGDECYPAKVTMGDYLKLLQRPETDPKKTVLLMPTTDGPCRFGQYLPCLEQALKDSGFRDTEVCSTSTTDGYASIGGLPSDFERTAWRAVVCAEILHKALLRRRPYEVRSGKADQAYDECLEDLCFIVEHTPARPRVQMRSLLRCLTRCRERFRGVAVHPGGTRPLVGIVGEIFCRWNEFSNDNLIRRLEESGAEAWLSDLGEWIKYTYTEQRRNLRLAGRWWARGRAAGRFWFQQHDEHRLLEPFRAELAGREEPEIDEVLECAVPYLPPDGVIGEMVLSVGRAACLARRGAAGIIDISPFACMNGTVAEAIYPRLSRDLGGIPIRNFYFDGTQSDLDGDLGAFLELARGYAAARGQF